MTDRARLPKLVGSLKERGDYADFAEFVRLLPVRNWLAKNLNFRKGCDPWIEVARAVNDLDHREAEFLPEKIADIAPRTEKTTRAIFELVTSRLRKRSPEALVREIEGCRGSAWPTPVPDAWRLNLPIPPEREELKAVSPSALDAYLRCPFNYYLTRVFGDKRFREGADSLETWEVGNVVHDALDGWAKGALKDSADAAAIAAELASRAEAILTERFGAKLPGRVPAQFADIRRRLTDFAAIQAARRADGWRIVETERKLEMPIGHTRVYGRCDRIDRNEKTGEVCVLDYKTWAKASGVESRREDGSWRSLQLPLYAAMLAADFGRVTTLYAVLGESTEEVAFVGQSGAELADAAVGKARELIGNLERGIFYPPSPQGVWRRAFADWVTADDPELGVSSAWLADQRRRLGGAAPAPGADAASAEAASALLPRMRAFEELRWLARHPSDLSVYRHFSTTPLAAELFPDGVPDVTTLAALVLI